MDKKTRQQLLHLNQLFYSHIADSFSNTRQSPNSGWERLLPLFSSLSPLKILDLASGNGRFPQWLLAQPLPAFQYLGLEQDEKLLQIANNHQQQEIIFAQSDITSINKINDFNFSPNIITAFGVTHHLPGKDFRLYWFEQIASLITSGYFMYTHWQIEQDPRFRKATRLFALPEHNLSIQERDLEEGDYFLPWQVEEIRRYVHVYSDAENQQISKILESQGFTLADRFTSDGKTNRLNDYWVWKKI